MNDGVKILLARMETHPEEFVPEYDGGTTKWGILIQSYKAYLNEEDAKALDKAYNGLMQQYFTKKVMEELLDPQEAKQTTLNLAQQYSQVLSKAAQNTPQLLPSSNRLKVVRKPITKFGKLYTP